MNPALDGCELGIIYDPAHKTRISALIARAHLPLTMIARETGYSIRTVTNWAAGVSSCPGEVVAWIVRRGDAWHADPPPKRHRKT